MKVVLVYRKQRPDAFSIEELFRTIGDELRKYVDIVEYEVGERRHIMRDVLALRRMNADVYHVTGDVHYFAGLLPSGRTVLTVHDIGNFLFGLTGWKRAAYKWIWLTWPIHKAAAVTCISQDTSNKLRDHLGVAATTTIENCHSPLFRPVRRSFNKDAPRILQVGTKPYKNVPRLIRALKGIPCTLVLIGQLDHEILTALAQNEIRYESRMNLSQPQLVREYVEADLVSFVSVGEGFGVPIIEAQASARPLVTSDVSPLREVAGAGACLVDPYSETSIRAGILRVIGDDAYRESVVEAGLANVTKYSPATIARRYLTIYTELSDRAGSERVTISGLEQ